MNTFNDIDTTTLQKIKLFCPLIPLRDAIILPHTEEKVLVGRNSSVAALQKSKEHKDYIILTPQKNATTHSPGTKNLHETGLLGKVIRSQSIQRNAFEATIQGISRIKIISYPQVEPFFAVSFEEIICDEYNENELKLLVNQIRDILTNNVNAIPNPFNKKLSVVLAEKDTLNFLDKAGAGIPCSHNVKMSLLMETDPIARANTLLNELVLSKPFSALIEANKFLKGNHDQPTTRNLRQPLPRAGKVLPASPLNQEIEGYKTKAKEKNLPKEAFEKFDKEINRLVKLPPVSPESGIIRTYIDLLLELPWNHSSVDKTDINAAHELLESQHYALEEAKERILEFIAVHHFTKSNKGPILCLVGPPGTGKSSLAKSLAEALDRKFMKISLGGVRDEAEIRGHRRTYIGAMPGRIIQAVRKSKTNNPVILLDEIDKTSSDYRGDPSSALLEVLDPEQNKFFSDHYLELEFDLSRILFVATANNRNKIPPPLLDRMEVIKLSGYTEFEKEMIATKFLIPKQQEANGLSSYKITFRRIAVLEIIRRYTKEAGVRQLEQQISKIYRKVAREIIEKQSKSKTVKSKTITGKEVEKFLGVPKYRYGKSQSKNEIGLANGLAWTEVGGDLLPVEVVSTPGDGKLLLTGHLGDVMQESAKAAYTYIKSILLEHADSFKNSDFHIHVPEGAIPKDGPSAGVTLATVIASIVKNVPVRCDVAMTGELTLKGKVLPIGGLKEKILAALRAGITEVIIPAENQKDLSTIPEEIIKDTKFHFVKSVSEVLDIALE